MKEKRDLYFIAALVDGEIKDIEEEKKLREQIDTNPDLNFEYFIQSSIKNLVSERLRITPAPLKVRKRLEKNISPAKETGLISKLIPDIYFKKPVIAWGSTIVLVLALALIIINRTPLQEQKNFALEQRGNANMYLQAKINFENILAGKLSPQFTSADPGRIKAFFTKNGVSYPTYVPKIKNWTLVGAVVSVDHGEKFAHHVYSTADGKLVYLFQVDESEIKKHNILSLTDDLISYLNTGHCYETMEGSIVTLMTKVKGNIFAVVSNSKPDEIENNLCHLN